MGLHEASLDQLRNRNGIVLRRCLGVQTELLSVLVKTSAKNLIPWCRLTPFELLWTLNTPPVPQRL